MHRNTGGKYSIKRREVGEILRTLCEWKKVKIVEAEVCPDHVHMLVEIPPKISVSSFMGYLKGKSSLMIYEKYPELRYKYRNREFWCRGYYVDTAGKNAKRIQEYIQRQIGRRQAGEQLTMGKFLKRSFNEQQVTILCRSQTVPTRPGAWPVIEGYARL